MIKRRVKKPVWTILVRYACLISAVAILVWWLPKLPFLNGSTHGPIIHEETSEYSKIRVRGDESKRSLMFVSEAGRETLQSSIDLDNPSKLKVAYTKALFNSLLLKHPQKKILIVGLGGGGMVRFAETYLPDTFVEAVEIDPAVVSIADKYFHTRDSSQVKIHTADAFDFLADSNNGPYDAIYMDAFLRPSVDKDVDGKTGRLKTVEFLKTIKNRLTDDGILACNLISYRPTTPTDLAALEEVFAKVYEQKVAGTGNLAVFAVQHEEQKVADPIKMAAELEKAMDNSISFKPFAKRLK